MTSSLETALHNATALTFERLAFTFPSAQMEEEEEAAEFEAAAEHVGGHRVAARGGDGEPAPRQRGVAGDAAAVEEDLPEQRLGLRLAGLGGGEDPARRLARFAVQGGVRG